MLQHPTIDRLRELGLEGMAKSLRDLAANPETKALDHLEWLGILLEHETTRRQQKRFEARARTAKLRHSASVEDVDYRAAPDSTARCSSNSPAATGSASTVIAS